MEQSPAIEAPAAPEATEAPAAEATPIEQAIEQATKAQQPEAIEATEATPEDLDERITAAVAAALERLQPAQPEPAPVETAEPASEPHPAEEALKARITADLETLGDEDRALVEAIAGDDMIAQAKIYTALMKAGKISAKADEPKTPAPPVKRTDMNSPGTTQPTDWKSAEAAFARAVRGVRF